MWDMSAIFSFPSGISLWSAAAGFCFPTGDIDGHLSSLWSPSDLSYSSDNVFLHLLLVHIFPCPMSCLFFFWCWCNSVKCHLTLATCSKALARNRMTLCIVLHWSYAHVNKQYILGSEIGLLVWCLSATALCPDGLPVLVWSVSFKLFLWRSPLSAWDCFISALFFFTVPPFFCLFFSFLFVGLKFLSLGCS